MSARRFAARAFRLRYGIACGGANRFPGPDGGDDRDPGADALSGTDPNDERRCRARPESPLSLLCCKRTPP